METSSTNHNHIPLTIHLQGAYFFQFHIFLLLAAIFFFFLIRNKEFIDLKEVTPKRQRVEKTLPQKDYTMVAFQSLTNICRL